VQELLGCVLALLQCFGRQALTGKMPGQAEQAVAATLCGSKIRSHHDVSGTRKGKCPTCDVRVCCCCRLGVEVRHMWGMTEISPLGSLGVPSSLQIGDGLSREELLDIKVC
jgi:hypothetical protein